VPPFPLRAEPTGEINLTPLTSASRKKAMATIDGRWFSVCILPYRTLDNRIDGVVITFVDITTVKLLEVVLHQQQSGR
jgi:two-component system CheB/CheR fusion protein